MFQSVRQPLLWSFIYIVILLLSFTPLGLVTISFIMIPVLILYVKLDMPKFIVYYLGSLFATYLLTLLLGAGGLGITALAISAFFLAPALVMAHLYKKKSAARTVVTAGVISFLSQMLLILISLSLFGINVVRYIEQFLLESMKTVPELWRNQIPEDMVDLMVHTMTQMLPLFLIGFSCYYIVITHALGRTILNRTGENIAGFKPMKDWMLPKSFVWYYLIALILSFFEAKGSGSVVSMILLNLVPLLMFTFAIQAVAFLFFTVHLRGWSRAMPITALILIFLFPFLQHLFAILGVFDVAFPLRDRLRNNK